MKDSEKTNEQLISELLALRQRVAELEASENDFKQVDHLLRVERDRFKTILNTNPNGIYIVDQQHTIEYINPFIEGQFGPVDGRKCYQYFHDRTESCPWCKNDEVFAGKSVWWEWYSKISNRHYDLFDTPIKNPDGSISKLEIFHDITKRKQAEEILTLNETRLEAQVKLNEMEGATIEELASFVVEEGAKLTRSKIGFIGFINDDQRVLSVYAYSQSVMGECDINNNPLYFPLEKAGIWGEAVRQRKPIIVNDYLAPNPYKKGYPSGHVELLRLLVIPVLVRGRVIALITVGNKEEEYNNLDLHQLKLLLNGAWKILEQKKTKQELQESECRYKKICESITDYIFRVSIKDGTPVETVHGAACVSVTGYTTEEFLADPYLWFSMVHEKDRENVRKQVSQIITGKNGQPLEHRIIRKDGTTRWVRNTPVLHFDEKTELVYYDGLVQDITEKKQAEASLQKAHDELELRVTERTAELRKINKQLMQEINERNQIEEDLRGKSHNLNERIKELNCLYDISKLIEKKGNSLEEILQGVVDLIPSSWQHPEITCARIIFNGQKFKTKTFKVTDWKQTSDITVDGNRRGALEVFYLKERPESDEGPFQQEERNLINAITERLGKIIERRQLQDQLIRSERLAATGQLAASVAHEINSPLQAVTSTLNTLKKTYKEDKKLLDTIDILKGSFYSIRDTVKRLLDLNRPDKGRKQSASINRIIEDTVRLVRSHLKSSRIKVNLSLSPGVPDIPVAVQQMSQAVLNLINNAVEAMTGSLRFKDEEGLKSRKSIGGEITIKTDCSEGNIIITVSDTGPGISKKDLQQIFDPFYTQKKQMGMGIGLSICHDIVEGHNGTIEAKNSDEGGAIFTVTLPVSKK